MPEVQPDLGIWLVDKPAGPTSHDIVATIRRRLPRGTRVGHAGTLDPFATGLLVVLTGRATRLARFLSDHDKTYRARLRLGATSASGDPEGPITATNVPVPGRASIDETVAGFRGPQRQRVPALSAVKVDGERLYRRTRRGEQAELPERDIVIHDAEVLATDLDEGWLDVEVRCSKGTYLRQFASDVGARLGCGAYCEALRRLAVGSMHVDDAVTPEAVTVTGGIPPTVALAPMAAMGLDETDRERVRHGRAIRGGPDGPVMLVADERLLAIGLPTGDGHVHPAVVLA